MRVSNILPRFLSILVLGVACAEPEANPIEPSFAKAPSGPTVSSTAPDFSARGTTIDVRVLGSGFDNGTQAAFLRGGIADPKVVTNSTRFVSSSEVVANITVAADAVIDYRDVAVTTSIGKKGIGTQKFQVIEPIVLQIAGATQGNAWDVNASGQVTGAYTVAGTTCTQRAYVWSEAAGLATLPVPSGYCQARGRGINSTGVVSGTIWPTGGALGTAGVPVRWIPNGPGSWNVEILPKPSAGFTLLENLRISDNGSVTSYWDNGGVAESWLWQPASGWTQLAGGCTPWDINAADVVVGCGIWTSPSALPTALPLVAGATSGRPRGINNLGVVVGQLDFTVRNGTNAYLARWTPDGAGGWTAENLGVVGGGGDVNDEGTIVGTAFGLWYPAFGVSPLIATKGTTVYAVAISNRGPSGIVWIVGYGQTSASVPTWPIIWKK